MSDTTLADVLDDEDEDLVQFALTARRYLEANRTALERMTLEQQVRSYWGVHSTHPVQVLTDQGNANRAPRSVQGRLLEVGANWKPEVGR
jgi:hypothetical protein